MRTPQGYDSKAILYRIGTFFLLVGIGLIVFFVLSEAAHKVMFDYFCWGILVLVVGFIFRAQYKKAIGPSGRFSYVRKLMPKSKRILVPLSSRMNLFPPISPTPPRKVRLVKKIH